MAGRIETGPEGGERIVCIDPRNAQAVATVDCTPLAQVPEAIRRARQAQALWADLGLKRRKWAVSDLHQAFLARGKDLVELLAQECGRPRGETWQASHLTCRCRPRSA